MKIYLQLIICLAILSGIFSCQKSPTGNSTNPPVSYKIKTYSEDAVRNGTHTKDTFNLSYNANNQLVLFQSKSNPGNKIVFTYVSSTSYTQDFYTNNVLSIHLVSFLKNNLVDSISQDDTGYKSSNKFIYNSLNQLITSKDFENNQLTLTTTYTYDGAGNMVKQTDTNGNVVERTYYTDQPDFIEFLIPYFKTSVNLVKTEKSSNASVGYVQNATHTYIFDSQKRVVTETVIADNNESVVKGFTYY